MHPAPASSPRERRRSCVRRLAAGGGAAVILEGTGFTGREIRESFTLASRAHPVEMVYYDNQRDDARALANAEAAIARKVDLYIQYHRGAANTAVGEKLRAAGIKVLALNAPVPGAPLYTADNLAAGQLAGEALAQFALRAWRGQDRKSTR